ncbi:hypothetical protein G7054_g12077 [Neopestalotiopsis clavispora]|nr:hypothetical protein G7054_g12077 [Neopestalotiopsis clavispora]
METKQPTIWAVLVVTFVLATVCLLFRIFSRFLKKASFWWDDFFAIGAYIVAIAWLITCPIWMANGLGMHIEDVTWLTLNQAIYQSKLMLYIAEIIYAFGLYFAKMSVLLFYWRLFNVTNLRYPMIALMAMSTIWIIIRTFMAIFHCVPVRAFWDLTIVDARCDIDDKKFFFGSVLVHLLIDVMILSLPVFQIGKLQLRKMQKIGIIAMFTFGFTICVCAVAIIVGAANFDTTSVDITWNVTDIVTWASAEVNLVTVSACFPTIRPAFMFFFGRWLPTTLGSGPGSEGVNNIYTRSGMRSGANKKSIKLESMPGVKGSDEEESSVFGLAQNSRHNSHRGGNSLDNHDSDFEVLEFDGNPKGVSHTTVSYSNQERAAEEGKAAAMLGISIKKETSIRVSDNLGNTSDSNKDAASNRSFA